MKKRAGVPCDKDCFHCKFSDCIYDRLDAEDYAQSSERDKDMSRSPAQKKVAAQQRAYREKNREKLAAQKRAYYEANREKVAAQQRAYRHPAHGPRGVPALQGAGPVPEGGAGPPRPAPEGPAGSGAVRLRSGYRSAAAGEPVPELSRGAAPGADAADRSEAGAAHGGALGLDTPPRKKRKGKAGV